MNPLLINPIAQLLNKSLDLIFPDPQKKLEAQIRLVELEQNGELKELEASMAAILEEARSQDPWTSRARPTFLYVIYVMVLMAIPMGFVAAVKPELASAVATGMQMWLGAIPEPLYTLFGLGYLGYAGARSWEKGKGLTK